MWNTYTSVARTRGVLALLSLLLILPRPGQSQEDYNVELVSEFGGAIYDVSVQGSLAFVIENSAFSASGYRAVVRILECSDPTNLQSRSEIDPEGRIEGIDTDWGRLAIATEHEVVVFDVSDPSRPRELARISEPYDINEVVIRGDLVYVGASQPRRSDRGSFEIYDLSEPERPFRLSQTPFNEGIVQQMEVDDDRAYIVIFGRDEDTQLVALDVSDPEQVAETSRYGLDEEELVTLRLDGDRVYLHDVDIRYQDSGSISEDWVHVLAAGPDGVLSLLEIARIEVEDWSRGRGAFEVHDSMLYLGRYRGFDVHDLSDPAHPIRTASKMTPGSQENIVAQGGRAYLADGSGGLRVYETSGMAPPSEVGALDVLNWPRDLALDGDIAIVAIRDPLTWVDGVTLVDVSDPARPTELSQIDPWNSIVRVHAADGLAVLTDERVRLVDVSDPRVPRDVGVIDPGLTHFFDGNRLLVGGHGDVLRVMDVSDPSMPTQVAVYQAPDRIIDAAMSGNMIYVSVDQEYSLDEFRVLEIVEAGTVVERGVWIERYMSGELCVGEDVVYMAGSAVFIMDVSDPTQPRKMAEQPLHSSSMDYVRSGQPVLRGSNLFVPRGAAGISVVDVSNPARPALTWRLDTPGITDAIGVSGTQLTAASWTWSSGHGLTMYDLASAIDPEIVGVHATPASARGVALSGEFAYVADYSGGMVIFDVVRPESLHIEGSIEIPGYTNHVEVVGPAIYAGVEARTWSQESAIAVFDQTAPGLPVESDWAVLPSSPRALAADESHVCVITYADYMERIAIYGVGPQATVDSLGYFSNDQEMGGLAVDDGVVYVGLWDRWPDTDFSEFTALDIEDPSSPVELSRLELLGKIVDIRLDGTVAIVTTWANHEAQLYVVNVADPTSPLVLGSVGLPHAGRLSIDGQTAYVAAGEHGVQLVDISDPGNPLLLDALSPASSSYDIAADGGTAFVAGGASGLVAMQPDGSNPPVQSGDHLADAVAEVAVFEDRVVAIDDIRGLRVIDVTSAGEPVQLSSLKLSGMSTPDRVAVQGNLVFWAGDGGFRVIDLSDESVPVEIGAYKASHNDQVVSVRDIAVRRGYVYLAEYHGLRIVDVRNPESPEFVSSLIWDDGCLAVDLHGDTAFLVAEGRDYRDTEPGIWMIDVSDPGQPREIGFEAFPPQIKSARDLEVDDAHLYAGPLVYARTGAATLKLVAVAPIPGKIERLDLVGPTLYAASGEDGLIVLDVADPSNPRVSGQLPSNSESRGCAARGGTLYLADDHGGLRVVDVGTVGAPRFLGSFDPPSKVSDIAISGTRIYMSDHEKAIQVVDVSDPAVPIPVGGSFNPCAHGFEGSEGPSHLDVEESTLCWLCDYRGFGATDTSEPWDPFSIQELDLHYGMRVRLQNGLAYTLTDGSSYLKLVDVRDPHAPQEAGSVMLEGECVDVSVGSDFANVVTREEDGQWRERTGWLHVVDASDPSAPEVRATTPLPTHPLAVHASGNSVFVGFNDSLIVYDATDLEFVHARSGIAVAGSVYAIRTEGTTVFAGTSYGVRVYELLEGGGLEYRGESAHAGIYDLEVGNGHVYAAAGASGLQIYRYFPTVDVYPGDTNNDGTVDAMDVLPLALHFGTRGTPRAEASLVWQPQPAKEWASAAATYADTDGNGEVDERDLLAIGLNWGRKAEATGAAYTVGPGDARLDRQVLRQLYWQIHGNEAAATAMRRLLEQVLGQDVAPRRYDLRQNDPNPFNPETRIAFDLPTAAKVSLAIYDLRGRRVKTLIRDEPYPPGRHFAVLRADGLASGVYVYRLESDLGVRTRKMALLK